MRRVVLDAEVERAVQMGMVTGREGARGARGAGGAGAAAWWRLASRQPHTSLSGARRWCATSQRGGSARASAERQTSTRLPCGCGGDAAAAVLLLAAARPPMAAVSGTATAAAMAVAAAGSAAGGRQTSR